MPRPIVVLVSANAEWAPVKEYLAPAHVERTPYGECFTRPFADGDVVFLHGGWGKISTAASTEYAITRWTPEALINVGTCGGIGGRAARGETLLVTRAITYDIYESMGDSAEAIRWYTTDVDVSWLDDRFPLQVRRSHIVSADRDLMPGQVDELVGRFDAIAGDWESGAIAFVAHRRAVPLLIIRTVSDLVTPQAGETVGDLPVFQAAATNAMRALVDDLATLVPYVRALRRAITPSTREPGRSADRSRQSG
jgi:adenosylhomocysteine nucleosidase